MALGGELSIPDLIAATGAVGTAAFGMVDGSKAFAGGVSRLGLRDLESAMAPFRTCLENVDRADPMATLRANWLNGVEKATQKATAKSLVRLGLSPAACQAIEAEFDVLRGKDLPAVAEKALSGGELTEADINLLGRLDGLVEARLDAGFERADQRYRNGAKLAAGAVSLLLSIVGGWVVLDLPFSIAALVGLAATPLAPIAKDLSSAIAETVTSFKSVRGGAPQ